MNVSWKKYMKVGLVQFMAFPQNAKRGRTGAGDSRKGLTDDFFDVIEITTIKDPEVRQQAKRMLESSKMTVAFGGQPVQLVNKLNINSFDALNAVWR
jgi:hypothetical protein